MTPAGEYLRLCPKVELHVHLEGAVRPDRLLAILRRHGAHDHLRTPADVEPLFRHADFAEFLAHFRFVVLSMRDVQDVHDVARDLFLELAAQHVVYAEVIFSAPVFTRAGMALGELLAAASDAASAGERAAEAALAAYVPVAAPAPRYNLVVDLVRNFGARAAERSVEALAEAAHPRVVGIHLGGDEAGFPAREFGRAFAAARDAGLGCAAHAGEAAGAQSVRDAVCTLGAVRIGHGIRALDDPDLIAELVARDVTLEVCPTSNLRTGIVSGWDAHPLPKLLAAGVGVTLGADDPSYFDTDLTRELEQAHARLGLGLDVLDGFAERGLRAAFLRLPERGDRLRALHTAREAVRAAITSRARR